MEIIRSKIRQFEEHSRKWKELESDSDDLPDAYDVNKPKSKHRVTDTGAVDL